MLFEIARPALFSLDPERAHGLTLKALKLSPRRGPAHAGAITHTVLGDRYYHWQTTDGYLVAGGSHEEAGFDPIETVHGFGYKLGSET